jgi:hypothetical protein
MTVAELIERLQTFDSALEVYTHGYEGGYNDVEDFKHITVCRNYNTESYYGNHEDLAFVDKSPADLSAYNIVRGIVL